MADLSFFHHVHGMEDHNLAILIAKDTLVRKQGYRLKDTRVFIEKHCAAGEPDIFLEVKSNGTNGHGRGNSTLSLYVIEVESKPTKASVEKKYRQFEATMPGIELIVVDLRKWVNRDSIGELRRVLAERLP